MIYNVLYGVPRTGDTIIIHKLVVFEGNPEFLRAQICTLKDGYLCVTMRNLATLSSREIKQPQSSGLDIY